MDLEFPGGRGGPSGKITEIPGGGGSNVKPFEMENLGGVKLEKTLRGGYGYFLEPHIVDDIDKDVVVVVVEDDDDNDNDHEDNKEYEDL